MIKNQTELLGLLSHILEWITEDPYVVVDAEELLAALAKNGLVIQWANLTQWEYTMKRFPQGTLASSLNEYGAWGWELCSVQEGAHTFKRPVNWAKAMEIQEASHEVEASPGGSNGETQ